MWKLRVSLFTANFRCISLRLKDFSNRFIPDNPSSVIMYTFSFFFLRVNDLLFLFVTDL